MSVCQAFVSRAHRHRLGAAPPRRRFDTPHGTVQTPAFMPVGTQGAVKAVACTAISKTLGAEIILGNTYHLFLRPGDELIARRGGLHRVHRLGRSRS